MADNPFAKFAAAPASSNPFAKFADTEPQQTPEIDMGVSWDAPESEVRAAINVLPNKMRGAAMKEWSKRRVSKERKEAGNAQTAYDVGRNLLRGTPVGSWLDEGVAGVKSMFGGDYDENVALERERNAAADANATKLGTLPLIGDVTTGGLTKLAGGILSAPISPALRIAQGAALLPRMANAAATGVAYGGVYGAGEGEGADRAKNAALGAVVGGGVGAAVPAVAQGVGNAWSGLRNARQNPLPYDTAAVSRVARAVDDDMLVPRYAREAADLGPPGMLADMGENLRGQAGAIANSPGAGQHRIFQALRGRRDGATHRIEGDLSAALGPAANVPRTVDRLRNEASARAAPHYDQFYNTPIRPTPELEAVLRRVPQSAWQEAQRLAEMEGVDLANVLNTGRGLDLIKRAVDDMAQGAERGSNLERLSSNIARDLRNETDRILSPNNPAASPWAIARREAGEGLQFREAAEEGQGAFRRSLTPDQMDVDLDRMNPLQQEAYRVGARDAARTTMGNAGTAWGPNGDAAARRMLQTEFGAEKVRRIAPNPANADRLAQRLETETRFAGTDQAVMQNSATARRQAAQQEFPGPTNSAEEAYRLGSRTVTGVVLEGVYRLGNLLTNGAVDERRARIADHAARMLIAQGVGRDAIMQGLQQFIQRRRLSGNQAQRISRFIERFGQGAPIAAAGGATRSPLEVTVYPSGDPRNGR